MNIKATAESKCFDLYNLGPNKEPKGPGKQYGFRGLNLRLQEAQVLARDSRLRGWATVVVPVDYRDAELSLTAAREIAIEAFERHKLAALDEEFGELDSGADEGGWWFFLADNLTAQEAGFIPGLVIVRVDKLLKRPLSTEEKRWVDSIQVP